jgi:D-alanyl-D-alanine carboxypeptidase (penicillin-binding protein 5/6)
MISRHSFLGLFVLTLVASIAAVPGRAAVAVETIAKQAIVKEMATGKVLFEKNSQSPMEPASMAKMMTVYLIFERLRDGRLSLDDTFPVSENAWRKGGAKSGGSTMFLEPGSRARLEDLIRGIVVQSGNDACIVLAEGLAGKEETFAAEMTAKAKALGMADTVFKNATGWPAPDQTTTAADLAILAERTVRDFPQYYHYYAEKSFTYNGIRQSNRNPLLYKTKGADGLKTGHTVSAGYGLAASAERENRRLVSVAGGLPSKRARSRESERLLEWGFREFANYTLFKKDETVAEAAVWLGKAPRVPLVIPQDLTLTLPKKSRRDMKVKVSFMGPIPSPIEKGAPLAKLLITVPDEKPMEVTLVAGTGVEKLGLFGRLSAALQHIMWGEAK